MSTQTATQQKKLTQADLARAWKVSPGRISQLVAEGMPLDSLYAAVSWRRIRHFRYVRENGREIPIPSELETDDDRYSVQSTTWNYLIYDQLPKILKFAKDAGATDEALACFEARLREATTRVCDRLETRQREETILQGRHGFGDPAYSWDSAWIIDPKTEDILNDPDFIEYL